MTREDYLKSPTKMSALSFWKTNHFNIPENILVLNEYSFCENLLNEYSDEKYFKLIHDLNNIDDVIMESSLEFRSITNKDLFNHINSCYEDISITMNDIENMKSKETYNEELWFSIYDKKNSLIVATAICQIDFDIAEGYLDWIQVSKEYRGKGLGKALVLESLKRLKTKADFVTVSGKLNDNINPLKVYEKCRFNNKVIWHILTKK